MSVLIDILRALGLIADVVTTPGWQKWIDKSAPRLSDGNDARFFIGGEQLFPDMVKTLETESDENTLILLAGWSCDSTFSLDPATTTSTHRTTLKDVLTRCNAKSATIRALLWNNTAGFLTQNTNTVNVINGLSNGAAILDNRTPLAGSHHQKFLVVVKPTNAVAYCGGIDMDPNRVPTTTMGTGPLHDTHAAVVGQAAIDFATLFASRWNDHPNHQDKFSGDLTLPQMTTTFASPYTVQVGATFSPATPGNSRGSGVLASLFWSQVQSKTGQAVGDMNVGNVFTPYAFAQFGETGAFDMIKRGIASASTFIYMEDQYLVSFAAADELAKRISKSDVKVVILACHPDAGLDLEQVWERRKALVDRLTAVDPTGKQWTIAFIKFRSGSALVRGSYVHSKCWVFDDEFAIIGSANCNRRGYIMDSEAVVGIYGPEPQLDDSGTNITSDMLAKRFRKALWAKHLNKPVTAVDDPAVAMADWFAPPATARIATFNATAGTGPIGKATTLARSLPGLLMLPYGGPDNFAWNKILDPDGSGIP